MELRSLWKKAINQQILLIRMERENAKLYGELVTSNSNFEKMTVCISGVLMGFRILQRDKKKRRRNELNWNTMTYVHRRKRTPKYGRCSLTRETGDTTIRCYCKPLEKVCRCKSIRVYEKDNLRCVWCICQFRIMESILWLVVKVMVWSLDLYQGHAERGLGYP